MRHSAHPPLTSAAHPVRSTFARTAGRAMAIAALLACAAPSRADVMAAELLTQLASKDTLELAKARSYLAGVLDAEDFYLGAEMIAARAPLSERKASRFKFAHVCMPAPRPALDELVTLILGYAQQDSARGTGRAHSMIRFALIEKYPCPENP